MRTILFDIDGTLIGTGETVRVAFFRALEETFGFAPRVDGYCFGGKTDPQIVRELMTAAGVPEPEARAGTLPCLSRYLDLLEGMPAGTLHGRALPGVRDLLGRLAGRADLLLGLLSGNLARGARLKLAPLGLWDPFAFGAFADVSEIRREIAGHAVEEVRRRLGAAFRPDRVTVVGDTEHDVSCARAHGLRAVAVATGSRTRELLAAEGPDLLLSDFADVDRAEAALLGQEA